MSDPILFADVDGVLNDHKRLVIYRDHALRLLRVVRESKCKIVLSSAWRYPGKAPGSGFPIEIDYALATHAYAAGSNCYPGLGPGSPFWCGLQLAIGNDSLEITERVIGATPPDLCYGYGRFERRIDTIKRWINLRPYRIPDRFVAIDDLRCVSELGKKHSLVTDGEVGLTDDDADRLVWMLTGKTSLHSRSTVDAKAAP